MRTDLDKGAAVGHHADKSVVHSLKWYGCAACCSSPCHVEVLADSQLVLDPAVGAVTQREACVPK